MDALSLPVGARVRHAGQRWATRTAAPRGTAVVVGVGSRRYSDGSFDYDVVRGQDFSRRTGADNPVTTPDVWNSLRVVMAAPPRYAVHRLEHRLWGVWDGDTGLWVTTGSRESCERDAHGLNTVRLTLGPYGTIRRPEALCTTP